MVDMGRGGWSVVVLLMGLACSSGGTNDLGPPPPQSTDAGVGSSPVTPTGPATTSSQGQGGGGAGGAGGRRGRAAGTGGATGAGGASVFGSGFPTITGAAGATGLAGQAVTGFPTITGAAGASAAAVGSGTVVASGGGPTVDCVGGACAAPNVCVNMDFLFVACVPCGGNDQVCCPPYAADDPFLGTCDAGLNCAPNPNFQDNPPLDLVRDVCQSPVSPPPADGRLNHERLILFP